MIQRKIDKVSIQSIYFILFYYYFVSFRLTTVVMITQIPVMPKELRSHLVYKFSCSSCNATYYGKTELHLNVRSGEHIGLSPLTGNRVACKPSAISDHLLLHEDNNSSFNNFSILCCENNAYKLSILIKRDSPELSRNVSSMPLLLFN